LDIGWQIGNEFQWSDAGTGNVRRPTVAGMVAQAVGLTIIIIIISVY